MPLIKNFHEIKIAILSIKSNTESDAKQLG